MKHVSLAYARAHIDQLFGEIERGEIQFLIISLDGEANLTEEERQEVFRQAMASRRAGT